MKGLERVKRSRFRTEIVSIAETKVMRRIHRGIIGMIMLSIAFTGCMNYRVGNDVSDPTVMSAQTGSDCAALLFGLGFEPTVTQAMQNGGVTRIRSLYDTNVSLLGIGKYFTSSSVSRVYG